MPDPQQVKLICKITPDTWWRSYHGSWGTVSLGGAWTRWNHICGVFPQPWFSFLPGGKHVQEFPGHMNWNSQPTTWILCMCVCICPTFVQHLIRLEAITSNLDFFFQFSIGPVTPESWNVQVCPPAAALISMDPYPDEYCFLQQHTNEVPAISWGTKLGLMHFKW